MRVLHCPTLIGGHAYSLAKAERRLGIESRCIALAPHPFGYPADEWLSGGGLLATHIARWQLLATALRSYDIVHFNFGETAMPQRVPVMPTRSTRFPPWVRRLYNLYAGALEQRDLRWLKARGKTVVVTFQGDDARQGEYLRAHFSISQVDEADYYSVESDRLKRERVAAFARYADGIFALNPDLLHILPVGARFLPYANVDVRNIEPVPPKATHAPVLLHAPTHRGGKGTRFLVEAVNRLKAEGIPFEFVLVEGLQHGEAMKLYARSDLLVDQLLAGWYGGLAVELMALGKPVIAYLREADLGFLPPAMRDALPVINATPQSIYEVLKEWLTVRRNELPVRGAQSRKYVETWHDPIRIAESLKGVYEQLRGRPSPTEAPVNLRKSA